MAFTKTVVALKVEASAKRRLLIRNQVVPGQIAWVGLFCVAIVAASVVGGASFAESASFLIVLVPQVVFGVGLWAFLSRSRKISMMELLAVGAAVGPVAFALCVLCLLMINVSMSQIVVGVVLTSLGLIGTVFLVQSNAKMEISVTPRLAEVTAICISLVASLLAAVSFWVVVDLPRDIQTWGTIGGDAAAEEARANSLMLVGLDKYLLAEGQTLKYHMFGHLWSGAIHVVTDAGAFVTTTRIVPILTTATGLLLTWVWVRALSKRDSAAFLAVIFLATAGIAASFLGPLYLPSFSQSWGVSVGALFLVVWWWGQRGTLRYWWLILGLAAFAMTLAKVNTVILVAAAVMSALVLVVRRENRSWYPVISSACAAALAMLAILFFEYGYGNGLVLSFTQTATYLGFSSDSSLQLPTLFAIIFSMLLLITPWLSASNLAACPFPLRAEVVSFAAFLCVTALVCTVFLGQPGQSQVYFSMTAGVVLIPLAAWGVTEAWNVLGLNVGLRVAIALTTVVLVVIWLNLGSSRPTLQILSMYGLAAAGAALAVVLIAKGAGRRVTAIGFATTAVTTATFILLGLFWAWSTPDFFSRAIYDSQSSNGLSANHVEAIEWLQEENADGSLVATNFVCSNPSEAPPDCLAITFPLAAVGGQPMLLEGFTYSAGIDPPTWALDRLQLVEELVRNQSDSAGRELKSRGVEWIFIDKRRTTYTDWHPAGLVVFENADASILRLH